MISVDITPFKYWVESHFLPYQLRWIFDNTRVALAVKGRQLGFSDGSAGRAIYRGLFHKRPQIFISASQGVANEFVETVRTHCEVLAALGYKGATQYATNNTEELAWQSGGRVLALSSSDRTGRSFHGDLYLDEYAYHQSPEKIWKAAAPMATRGWDIRVISTPNGAQGLFYQWVQEPPPGWSIHRVSLDDAERDGLTVDRQQLFELVGSDERVFSEAYQLAFLDANMQYLPTAMLDYACSWNGAIPDLSNARIFAGLDIGRHKDTTALVVIAVVGRIAWVIAVLTCPRTKFKAQKALVREARATLRWEKLFIDKTGLGEGLTEELIEEFGSEEAIPVQFTEQSKAELCTRTLRWLRNQAVRFPKGELGKTFHKQGISLRRVITPSNNVVYKFANTSDGHCDEFTGFMLALKGAGEPKLPRGLGQSPVMAVA